MNQSVDGTQQIAVGETATIENTLSTPLHISLVSDNDCQLDIDLLPGQVVKFFAGNAQAKVVLHEGDPSGLLVVKPETPS